MITALYELEGEPDVVEWHPPEINGMDAYMIDVESELEEKTICCRGITFGDGDISIMICGMNISHEELVKIAENINW